MAAAFSSAAPAGMRSVFLNGIDISSAKSQDLKNVDIHINEAGDIFIIAPHYQVNEEDTYVPLSKYVQGLNAPAHRPPQKIDAGVPLTKMNDQPIPKAGEPLSPPAATQMIPAAGAPGEAPAQPVVGKDPMEGKMSGPQAADASAGGAGAPAVPTGAPAAKAEPPPPALPGDQPPTDLPMGDSP